MISMVVPGEDSNLHEIAPMYPENQARLPVPPPWARWVGPVRGGGRKKKEMYATAPVLSNERRAETVGPPLLLAMRRNTLG